jgi:RNA recognition motif-containing protein
MAKKLYVGNLPYSATDNQLSELFAGAGQVDSAQVIIDRISGRSKGFGFVEMSTDEEAAKAIEMFNGYEMDGRKIVVNEARPFAPRDEQGFGGGARRRDDGFQRRGSFRGRDR